MRKLFIIFALSLFVALSAVAQQTIFVDASATGNNDGSSWANALVSLQDALAAASSGDEIWIAAGLYHPDQGNGLTPGDRSLSFDLKSGIQVHGGFAGTESSRTARDFETNVTVLSGDLASNDDGFVLREDNSYHVVRAIGSDDNTLLEGVTIVSGQADGEDADSLGGGIYISGGQPWIVNTRGEQLISWLWWRDQCNRWRHAVAGQYDPQW